MGITSPPRLPGSPWPEITLREAGLASDLEERLNSALSLGAFPGFHGLLLARKGAIAFAHFAAAPDEIWGKPLGLVQHGLNIRHDLRSITKSIVGLLYGIALEQGKVPPPSAPAHDAFPDYAPLFGDPLRRRMTIGHILSMRMGIAWDEGMNYADPDNAERLMEAAPDRIRFILERPMIHRPGSVWTYCGGATALLGHLIAKGTGQALDSFAAERLFVPLGISDVEWIRGSDGQPAAASGLRMTPSDLARIGQLMLDGGKGIVPRPWLAQSIEPRGLVEQGIRYGYQWWIGKLVDSGKLWHAGFGNGGQRLIVIPSLDLVVVILAGNYNRTDQWKMPVNLMSRIVMPALRPKAPASS
ncbi:serine hydrolase domain-containing protein [Aestuariivirga sp.]|uniref:serine hydrolase domain-containing protein n=1 Tax=Aestuariivirga sp. TaxID=2650926 RepID=UPI0039E28022